MLRRVRRHIEETGHRGIYSTHWPSQNQIGFSCSECEDQGSVYSTRGTEDQLPPDSEVRGLVGAVNHKRLEEWANSVAVPDSWRLLLKDVLE